MRKPDKANRSAVSANSAAVPVTPQPQTEPEAENRKRKNALIEATENPKLCPALKSV